MGNEAGNEENKTKDSHTIFHLTQLKNVKHVPMGHKEQTILEDRDGTACEKILLTSSIQ